MPEIRTHVHIEAPIAAVFEALSDHETFLRTRGVKTTVVVPGDTEKNGLGCRREVRAAMGVRFVEEITAWERPASFEYTIRESSLPVRHQGARIALRERAGGTDVDWSSRFEIPVPLLAPLLAAIARRALTRTFGELLRGAKRRLESPGGGASSQVPG